METLTEPITREHEFGPRDILPESMWVGLIRYALGANGSSTHIARAKQPFYTSDTGVWLPRPEHANTDLTYFKNVFNTADSKKHVLAQETHEDIATTLKSMEVTDRGCWISTASTPRALISITEFVTARSILEPKEHTSLLNKCGNHDCLYHRHYDFTLDVPSGRRALLYPNMKYFQTTETGITTAWGDTLPSVEASRKQFISYQKRCDPYVSSDKSLLMLFSIANISFLPTTGCWLTRSYYMTPIGVKGFENWQYDGYGRLKMPHARAQQLNYYDTSNLGHRTLWRSLGKALSDPKKEILNHKCGFRPCANPNHLIQVPPQLNVRHGLMMKAANFMMEGKLPIETGVEYLTQHAEQVGSNPYEAEKFWLSSKQ